MADLPTVSVEESTLNLPVEGWRGGAADGLVEAVGCATDVDVIIFEALGARGLGHQRVPRSESLALH